MQGLKETMHKMQGAQPLAQDKYAHNIAPVIFRIWPEVLGRHRGVTEHVGPLPKHRLWSRLESAKQLAFPLQGASLMLRPLESI